MKFRSVKYFIWSLKNRKSLKNWRARNFSSPSPDVIKNQILINNNLKDSLWIETGTYYGETTKLLSKISKKTISIEADKNLFETSNKILKNFKNVEILWASTREPYNYIQAKRLKCHIITVPPVIIQKIEKFGKSFDNLTKDTVKGFLIDSKKSKFKL